MKEKPTIQYVISEAVSRILERKQVLLIALFIPVLLGLSGPFIAAHYSGLAFLPLLMIILNLIVNIYIAIIVHRIVLIGGTPVPVYGFSRWSMRETDFLLYSIGFGLILLVCSVPLAFLIPREGLGILSDYRTYIAAIPAAYVASRISLVFPSIAVGKKMSYRESWVFTANHGLLMFMVVILVPLLFGIPSFIIAGLTDSVIFQDIWSYIATVFVVGALSVAFEAIFNYEHQRM